MTGTDEDDQQLLGLLAKDRISDVLRRYCRGIDRRDFGLVRSCYHPDATDDHGEYRGGLDGFLAYCEAGLAKFESTMHFLGHILIDVDRGAARSEAYAVAYHRLPATNSKPRRDFVVGFRYLDDFENRDAAWRIAARVCAFEWSRLDPVTPDTRPFPATYTRGRRDGKDLVFAPSLHLDRVVDWGGSV
jgi:hypothetical protein